MTTLSKYQDANTFYHDKPTKSGKPSSNNGYYYTSQAKLLRLPYDKTKVKAYFKQCTEKLKKGEILIHRHPGGKLNGKKLPPYSADEALGALVLGLLDYATLKANHFVWYGKGKKMSSKVIKDILEGLAGLAIRKAMGMKVDRNYFHEKKIEKLYQGAFRFQPGQIYYIKKANGKKPHKEEKLLAKLYVEHTLKNGSAGEKNFLWVLCRYAKSYSTARRCKPQKNFKKYHKKGHPIRVAAEKL